MRDDGQAHFVALQLLELKDGGGAVIDHFMSRSAHVAFFAQGLAPAIAL